MLCCVVMRCVVLWCGVWCCWLELAGWCVFDRVGFGLSWCDLVWGGLVWWFG